VVRRRQDVLVEKIERLARAMAGLNQEGERKARADLALSDWEVRRQRVRPEMQSRVFVRDSFVCCYCDARTVPLAILELLDLMRGWKGRHSHDAYQLLGSCCDHVVPVNRGGTSAPQNLVTACSRCSAGKADSLLSELGWPNPKIGPRPGAQWRGLTEYYRPLWEAAGKPDPTRHERWLRAFSA
jgi:5-methylcytosine-specific restriction endonuclease McrA